MIVFMDYITMPFSDAYCLNIQESIKNCKGIEATAKDTKSVKVTDPMIKKIGSGSQNAAGRTFTTVDIQNTPQ